MLGLVADPVIKVIARLEFEDSLRTGVLSLEAAGALRAAAPSLGSIPNPPGGDVRVSPGGGCHRDPPVRPNSNSAEFRTSVVLNHSCYEVLG